MRVMNSSGIEDHLSGAPTCASKNMSLRMALRLATNSFKASFFYGLAGPEGMQGRPWPLKSFLVLAFAAIAILAQGQAEVQNPTFPFWKVNGNSGTNSSTNFVGTTDNISLRFRTNNTEKMVVDSVGNVGIGTGTPGQRLHVYKTNGDAIVRVETPSSSYESRIEFWKWSGFNAAVGFYPGTSDLRLRTGQASDVIMEPNSTEVMRVTSGGNVGIGTAAPTEKLMVVGRIQANNPGTSPTGSQIILGSPANDVGITLNRGDGSGGVSQRWDIKVASDLALRFRTSNSVDRVTFTNGGRVGIGTNAPDTTLHVVGSIKMVDGNQATGYLMVSDANGVGKWTDGSTLSSLGNDWHLTGNSGTTAGTNFIGTTDAVDWVIKTNNTERARVKSTGNVGIATTTPGATLDVNGSGIIGTSNTNTGTNAVATGISNTTAGNYSFTSGQNNTITSTGTRGAVFNQSNSVTGNNSIAAGFQSNAGGNISYAFGYADTATGQGSAAFGFSNIASANYTFAAGSNNNATAAQATAFGNDNTVSGTSSFVTGGNNTASGSNTLVSGSSNTASGTNSIVTGNSNDVTATHALVVGNDHTVAGNYSVVFNNNNSNTSAATTSITGGYQSQTQSNIGLAIGWADTTTGTAAAAFGRQNRSTANYAFSTGYNNTASGSQSAAFGDSNGAAGQSSVAMGAGNYVSGRSSLVTGELDTITSIASFAMGNANKVTANGASAFGRYSTAGGYCSIVGGNNSYTRGDYSFAVGNIDTAYANYSFAAGSSNYAGGTSSAAFGNNNTVTGSNSFSTGDGNTVSGSNSFSAGNANIVSNYGSLTVGLTDTASGYTSVAFNRGNNASGNHATALGSYNSAPSFSELSVGMYSTNYTPTSTTTYSATDRIFNVGNGTTSTLRADALTILKNGNIGVGTSTPATDLHVVGSIRMVDGTQANGYVMVSDANGTGSWVNPSTLNSGSAWNLTGNSGTVSTTNFIGTTDNVSLRFRTNSTQRMVIDSVGNVGVGTGTPTEKLEILNGNLYVNNTANIVSRGLIISGARQGGTITWNNTGLTDPTYITFNNYDGNSAATIYESARISSVNDAGNNDGGLRFFTANNMVLSEGMRIDKNGAVGIGASPLDKLHVVGSIRMVDGNQANGYIMVSNANGTGAWTDPSSLGIGSAWNLTGNSATDSTTNFIGTTDNVPFNIKVNNQKAGEITSAGETFLGYQAGNSNAVANNTAVGYTALKGNTYAAENTAIGYEALSTQSYNNGGTGWNTDNTAVGYRALYSNQPTSSSNGRQNTAIGSRALRANTTGGGNVAVGYTALDNNTTASNNTAVGYGAVAGNTTGDGNTGVGFWSLVNNTSGIYNSGFGLHALRNTTTGQWNIAAGARAAESNTTGRYNVALGANALFTNTTSYYNTALGYNAGYSTTGAGNVFIGANAGYNETGSDKLYIDNTNSATPLIYGDFSTNSVTINDSLISKYFKMSNGANNGYLLQSDALGNGAWVSTSSLGIGSGWNLTGNSGTSAASNFIGTTDVVDFVVRSSNTERMRVTSGGNIGMGHTNPLARLVVAETVDSSGVLRIHNPSNQSATRTWIGFSADNAWGTDDINDRARIGMEVQTSGPGELFFTTGGYNNQQERVRINTNGYVGIGTRTPTSTMDIKGSFATTVKTAQIAGTNNPDVTGAVWIYSSGSGTITLPTASTCSGRRYVILNQTGGACTTSTYIDITTASVTSLANNTSIEVISDGTNWRQIK